MTGGGVKSSSRSSLYCTLWEEEASLAGAFSGMSARTTEVSSSPRDADAPSYSSSRAASCDASNSA
eukprot:CAMPEP_0180475552 /NCGR_PEP_ID=MMETSP1036_2-20121128/31262_1 /TAXON_ID=632150 /ORGANISM="Azadinium spinosum, Strain 3D9" /LENGTH=65 /DNA_ID=CAMNT_0022482925 /DNA_START=41 /DNA_END=235 /DNA_ORIENTATION=-